MDPIEFVYYYLHKFWRLQQVIPVTVGQNLLQVHVAVASSNANQIVERISSCEQVETHQDPWQV